MTNLSCRLLCKLLDGLYTKLAQEGCELVEELPELWTMYSYRVFTAHLHAALEGTNSLSF